MVAVLAVGREGLETALYPLDRDPDRHRRTCSDAVTPTWEPLLGRALGIGTAVGLG